MISLILAASLVVQPAPSPEAPASDRPDFREVLERWEVGVRRIRSYDLELELTMKTLVDVVDGVEMLLPEDRAISMPSSRSHIWRKDGKRRGEFLSDKDGRPRLILVWDGKEAYSLQPDDELAVIDKGLITFGFEQHEDYEATYRSIMGTQDRIAHSRARDARLLPQEGRYVVVDVPTTTPGDLYNVSWRVWLDPERNHLPARLSQSISSDGEAARSLDVENELREVAPGVWAPIRSTIHAYHTGRKSPLFGKRLMTCVLMILEGRSKFNVDMPDSAFKIKIPEGTEIVDRRKRANPEIK